MKANKILMIAFSIALYVTHVPLYILAFMISFVSNADFSFIDGNTLFILFFVVEGLLISLAIAIGVLSIISIFKGNENPSKVTMICKLALIPWFIVNFIICICGLGGMLNPFLFLGIIPAAILMIITAYIFMLATSLPDIAHFIHSLIKRKMRVTPLIIISIIFMFIFCLDVGGAIAYYVQVKDIETNSH